MRKLTESKLKVMWAKRVEGNDYELVGNTKDSKKLTDARKKAAKEIKAGKDLESINVNTGKIKYKKSLKETSGKSKEYEAFFRNALKRFNVTDPDQLEDDKKKEFYNYVNSNWESKEEKDLKESKKGNSPMLKEAKYNLRIDGEVSLDSADDMMRILELAGLSDTSSDTPMDMEMGDDMMDAPMDMEMGDEEVVSDMNAEIGDEEIAIEPDLLMSSKKYDAVDNMRSVIDSLNEDKEENLGAEKIKVSMVLEDGFDEAELKKAEDYFNSQLGHIYELSRDSLTGNDVSYTLNKTGGWSWSAGNETDSDATNISVMRLKNHISYFVKVKDGSIRYNTN